MSTEIPAELNERNLAAWMRDIGKKIGDNEAKVAEVSATLVAAEQRRAENDMNARRERSPNGDRLTKFVVNGTVQLKSAKRREVFAGQQIEREVPGLFTDAPCNEWHADLLRLASARSVAGTLLASKGEKRAATPSLDRQLLAHCASAPPEIRGQLEATIIKAIADTSTSGGEWIPDVYSSMLYEEFYTPNGIAGLFPLEEYQGGSLIIPSISDTIRPYIKQKISSDDPSKYTASSPGSANTTIDMSGLAARVLVDDAANEDSIFPLLPEINRRIARALGDAYEDTMINGDTAATHQDTIASFNIRDRWGSTGLGGSADHRRAFIGFRALAADRSCTVNQASGMTISKVMEELVGGLGERAGGNVVILVSPEVMFKKLMTDTNVLTVDKFAANATILRGQLAQVFGIPIVMTRWLSSKYNTSGIFDGSTMTKSGVLVVSRDEFKHYQRRGPMLEMERDITIGGYNLVATQRRKMVTLSSSSSKVAMWGYGWTGES